MKKFLTVVKREYIQRVRASVPVQHLQHVLAAAARAEERVGRAHEVAGEAVAAVGGDDAGAGVVGARVFDCVDRERDDAVALERADRDLGDPAAAREHFEELLARRLERDDVVAEGFGEREEERVEVRCRQRADHHPMRSRSDVMCAT